jgi:hypothetical protein
VVLNIFDPTLRPASHFGETENNPTAAEENFCFSKK